MGFILTNSTLFSMPSFFLHKRSLAFCLHLSTFSTSSASLPSQKVHAHKKWRQPVAASLLELGGVKIAREDIVKYDPTNNVPDSIFSKLGMQLHRRDHHPLGILKNAIYDYFNTYYPNKFDKFDNLCPIVSFKANFDDVLVPADHVSRSYNDTYYVDSQTVLRCHTSAHQAELLRAGHTHFLVTGDVYRRDSIDSTHYPVFHQMEGVRVVTPADWEGSDTDAMSYAAEDLKKCLEGLARHLFGLLQKEKVTCLVPLTIHLPEYKEKVRKSWKVNKEEGMKWNHAVICRDQTVALSLRARGTGLHGGALSTKYSIAQNCGVEMRWIDTYFPFTNPSFELEIYFQEKWLEVLGCGVMEQEILKRSGRMDNVAWAFGLGLERLAMVLFDIPDIRLFWTTDEWFTSQFSKGQLGVKFKPFSKYPPCYKDTSFWISDSFTENNLFEVVRSIAGDLVEEVKLIDNFTNKKGMTSHCYRIAYRSMERSPTDEEINDIQWKVREQVEKKLKVVLR